MGDAARKTEDCEVDIMRVIGLFSLKFALSTTCLLFGCGGNKDHPIPKAGPISEINVGMTYDEVEKLIGRPQGIARGVAQLKFDIDELSKEEVLSALSDLSGNAEYDLLHGKLILAKEYLAILQMDSAYGSRLWAGRKTIEVVGQLIYVTWIYARPKVDTFFVHIKSFSTHCDTTFSRADDYIINGTLAVDKETYDEITDKFWRQGKRVIGPTEYHTYDPYPRLRRELDGPVKVISKTIIPRGMRRIVTRKRMRDTPSASRFLVLQSYCIVFDSSSGRVVSTSYLPVLVSKIDS